MRRNKKIPVLNFGAVPPPSVATILVDALSHWTRQKDGPFHRYLIVLTAGSADIDTQTLVVIMRVLDAATFVMYTHGKGFTYLEKKRSMVPEAELRNVIRLAIKLSSDYPG